MTRWRPPTRPLILIALLLLAGAVVNVAVAWVLVGAPDSWTPGGPKVTAETVDPGQLRAVTTRLGAQRGWPAADAAHTERGFGWTVLIGGRVHFEPTDWTAWRVDGGWPARSLTFTSTDLVWEENRDYSWSIELSPRLRPSAAWFTEGRDRLPLAPAPAGFAINTLFNTAILALPLSFFPIRRRLRARRGRCPKCGYDLAGLAGAEGGAEGAAPCPECGATR